jgi:hypothetical protein
MKAQEPMPTHRKARELADAFEEAYPQELPERLTWWGQVLGIDRVRLLRMLGMSAKEAKDKKTQGWDTILQNEKWAERAWWVEGKLHEILSLFDYDWQALSAYLHHPLAQADGEEHPHLPRPRPAVEPLRYVASVCRKTTRGSEFSRFLSELFNEDG